MKINFFKNHKIDLLVTTLAILIILVLYQRYFQDFSARLYSDNAIYAILTSRFVSGEYDKALHIWWQPLYPFVASLVFNFTHSIEMSLFYTSVISGLLLLIPVCLIFYILTSSRFFSLLCGLMVTVHPQLVRSYFNLLTENLYILLFVTSIMFGVYSLMKKKLIFFFLTGSFFGIAYLVRNDVILPLQLYIFFLIIQQFFEKLKFKIILKNVLCLLLGFLIFISPYLYVNYQKFGYLNLSAKVNATKNMPAYFSLQYNDTTTFAQDVWSLDTPNYDSPFFNKPFPYWKYRIELWESSIERFKGYIKLIVDHESKINLYIIILGFFASLIYFLIKQKSGLLIHFVLIFGLILAMPFHPGVDYRYIFWMYPFFIIFSIFPVFIFNQLILFIFKKLFSGKLNIGYIIIICLNLLFIFYIFQINKNNLLVAGEFKKSKAIDQFKVVGNFIKDYGKKNPRIMTRIEAFTLYANGETIYIPSSIELPQLKKYAKLWNVDYIVSDRFTFAPDTPLGILVDEKNAPPWLFPIKTWDKIFTKTVLYEVKI